MCKCLVCIVRCTVCLCACRDSSQTSFYRNAVETRGTRVSEQLNARRYRGTRAKRGTQTRSDRFTDFNYNTKLLTSHFSYCQTVCITSVCITSHMRIVKSRIHHMLIIIFFPLLLFRTLWQLITSQCLVILVIQFIHLKN